MRRLIRKLREESFEKMRARLLAETSAFITECLEHPERAVRIPITPAESQRFPESFVEAFWDPVLLD